MIQFYKNNRDKFFVDYPQEKLDGELYKYKCAYCGLSTIEISGRLENHLKSCSYRQQNEQLIKSKA